MSSSGNIFYVTGPLWGESSGYQWIPHTKASDVELWCFLWSVHEEAIEQRIETQVIWDAITLIMKSKKSKSFPTQRPVTWSFDVFFDLCMKKQLSKELRCKWFEMPSHSLWSLKNLRALWFSHLNKINICQCMGKYFVWNFKGTLWNSTQNILPIHWKIQFLYVTILRALRFKSSLKWPPDHSKTQDVNEASLFHSNLNIIQI